jgi:hypothetical protein
VILRGREGNNVCSIADCVVRSLFPDHALFDHDAGTRLAKAALFHDLGQRGFGLAGVVTHRDPLARRQTVGLDHAGPAERTHVFSGQGEVVEDPECRGRDVVALHESLCKRFARFEPGGSRGRAETRNPPFPQPICDPTCERILRANHHEVDPTLGRQRGDGVRVGGGHTRDSFGNPVHRVAAGKHQERFDQRALMNLPRERVLASAGTDQQHAHRVLLVAEVPRAGKDHRDAEPIGGLDHEGVSV